MRSISFIIPVLNREKRLKEIFETLSLAKGKFPRGKKLTEVIFVDNGSRDNTFAEASRLAQTYPKLNVSIITYKKKLGRYAAIAEGIKASGSDINISLSQNLSDLAKKLRGLKPKARRKKKLHTPLLSVVMPVYNAENYLVAAINSVLKQTFRDFEFIIVDDASTDSSWKIIQRYAKRYPSKIKAYQNPKNIKQAKTVNQAISRAQGEYIARMDADDISLPTRFERQLAFLAANKKTVAIGSQCLVIDAKGKVTGEKKFPTAFEDIYKYIFKFCPVQQPTFMIAKRRLPRDFSFYNHNLAPVEDVELLFKLFKYGRVENMDEYLLLYRIHGKNSSLQSFRKSYVLTFLSRMKGILYHGYVPSISGVLITFAQLFVVLLLPQRINELLYQKAKSYIDSAQSPKKTYNKRLVYQLSKTV